MLFSFRTKLLWPIALTVFAVIAFASCSRQESATEKDAEAGAGPRIVSLSPALSRMLVDFGLEKNVVGRSNYCESLSSGVPVIGNLTHIDFEKLLRLSPTHLFAQPPIAGIDPTLQKLAAEHDWTLITQQPATLTDVRTMVAELPDAFDAQQTRKLHDQLEVRAQKLLDDLNDAVSPLQDIQRNAPLQVLIITPGEPVTAFGRETYLSQTMQSIGGNAFTNRLEDPAWAIISLEQLVRRQPDALLIVSTTGDVDTTLYTSLDIPAVTHNRIAILTHRDSQLPSTSIVEVAGELRNILTQWAGKYGE